jgi:hypothetical protein
MVAQHLDFQRVRFMLKSLFENWNDARPTVLSAPLEIPSVNLLARILGVEGRDSRFVSLLLVLSR